ncbi:sensor histidine kinase [Cryobacterium zhongshanensis]|uniref:histidine kinase n=1 Tax=Cryobacterium zhongshanensis TaxID=2928153 RepID=A0AA41QYE6_9MICO|nr:HAMP domain-containing sensor histidine kinase [Cryobacterium zhongshanensis]MCI4658216.1 HAMP domain-containing histidine kinase [Cryobacterium zhongshanensis]
MAALMGIALLVLLVQDIPLSNYLRQVETDRLVTSLERDAFVLAGRSEETLETPASSAAAASSAAEAAALTAAARGYRDSGGARVVIVNADGIAVVTSDDDQSIVGDSYASRPEIMGALGGQITSGHRYSDTLQIDLLYVTVPIVNGQDIVGAVRLTFPEQVVTDAVTRQISVLGLVALTTVVLAGIVGFIFSATVTRRLKLLQLTTERLADGDLDARADERAGAPEIRSLSVSFNRMATRLETLIEQQRTFAADASHQLRTPLTALRLRLERARELLEDDAGTGVVGSAPDTGPGPGSVGAAGAAGAAAIERLAAAEAEADRLGSIIEGLLVLSRTESSTAPVVECDVARVARERVEHWQPLAQELGLGIRYEGPDHATVCAIATAPEQIIDNYVDNALSASTSRSIDAGPEREIVVRVASLSPGWRVSVLDDGPGLSDEDCARAFDRFWRADSDAPGAASGNGLGLAIVAQLARASRAAVRLERRREGGLEASVTFDAAG